MAKFERGDRVVVVTVDEHDVEFRALHGGETGVVKAIDSLGWPFVLMDSGKTHCFSPGRLELEGSTSTEPEIKLHGPFVQLAVDLVRCGSTPEDAIESARKLQEASE